MSQKLYRYKLSKLDNFLLFKDKSASSIKEDINRYKFEKIHKMIFYSPYSYDPGNYEKANDNEMLDYIMEVRNKLIYYYIMFQEEYFSLNLTDKEDINSLYNEWYQETTDFLEKNKDKFGPDFVDNDSYFLLAVHKYKERRQVELFKMALIEAMKNNVEEEKVVLTFK